MSGSEEHAHYDELDAFTPIDIKQATDILTPISHEVGAGVIETLQAHGAEVTQVSEPYLVEDPQSTRSSSVREYKIHFPEHTQKEIGLLTSPSIEAYTIVFPDGFRLRVREHVATRRAILYLPKAD